MLNHGKTDELIPADERYFLVQVAGLGIDCMTNELIQVDEAADIVRTLLDIADRYDLEGPPGTLSQEEVEIIRLAEVLLEWLEQKDEA